MKLSLSMIAGNESDCLDMCLASVAAVVDEIVVVVNGDDATEHIARLYDATVVRDVWDNDFARTRNVALDHCTGDWILMLDADEWLAGGAGPAIRDLIASAPPFPTIYGFAVWSKTDDEGVPSQSMSYRTSLFPRHPDLRWQRRIHEQVIYVPDPAAAHYVNTNAVTIWHDGYLSKTWEAKAKAERNENIITTEINDNPVDPLLWSDLGRHYNHEQQHDRAMVAFNYAFGLLDQLPSDVQRPPWLAPAYYMATASALALDDYAHAIDYAGQGLARFPDYGELWTLAGDAALGLKNYRGAIPCFIKARSLHGRPHAYGNDPSMTSWRAARSLGEAWSHLHIPMRAVEWYLTALQEAPLAVRDTIREEMATSAREEILTR